MLFRSCALALLPAVAFYGPVQAQDLRTCNANPQCAALGLADDCCPTNLAGIFLDCCDNKESACDANSACVGLTGACCPTADGTFLYCCLMDGDGGYEYEYTYYAHARGTDVGSYWLSTGSGRNVGAYTHIRQIEYTRNPDVLYDLLYLTGNVPDAGAYVTGDKKFSMKISDTTAPPCTQIILQFEHVPVSESALVSKQLDPDLIQPYPKNRHSRYLATIPEDGNQQHVVFEFLDRPDDAVPDEDVNAVVILFAPGTNTADKFTFYNLDSNNECSNGGAACQPAPVNSCPAVYLTVEGLEDSTKNGGNRTRSRLLQPEDCSDCANPACVGEGDCAVDNSHSQLTHDADFDEPVNTNTTTTEEEITTTEEPAATDAPPTTGGQDTTTPSDENEPVDSVVENGTNGEQASAGASLFGGVAVTVGVLAMGLAWL
ncbi:glycoside hydrolase family 16 protein [Seminavis robusta]|uniref:Glycoside hydrolase family 16 protein n=1 Tax=Seminavis robusta TaxID=568900 RepID=A0A9N8E844_9STRA|nr:glycoside hydrolase family 16 protein [Seminavis robusta]|eukprot:Sro724_g193120.1 glycoside hydrolase family 16 protein (431) ;mRNA; r:11820-13273